MVKRCNDMAWTDEEFNVRVARIEANGTVLVLTKEKGMLRLPPRGDPAEKCCMERMRKSFTLSIVCTGMRERREGPVLCNSLF